MKKIVAVLIVAAMLVSLTACGGADQVKEQAAVAETVGADTGADVLEAGGAVDADTGISEEGSGTADVDTDSADEAGETADIGTENGNGDTEHVEGDSMKITAGNATFTATLAENSSVEALKELLAEGPLTIDMHDYANMEKVGPIGKNLPTNDEQISTGAGDIILYQGNSLVIYYDTNSWNFTRIGKIEGVTGEELLDAFGEGDVTVTFTLE